MTGGKRLSPTIMLATYELFNEDYEECIAFLNSLENQHKDSIKNKVRAFNEITIAIDRMIAGEYLDIELEGTNILEEGEPKITGKPVGNDKERGKITYVSYYGLDGAKKELEKIVKDAVNELETYGENAEFLRQLVLFIKDRNK